MRVPDWVDLDSISIAPPLMFTSKVCSFWYVCSILPAGFIQIAVFAHLKSKHGEVMKGAGMRGKRDGRGYVGFRVGGKMDSRRDTDGGFDSLFLKTLDEEIALNEPGFSCYFD